MLMGGSISDHQGCVASAAQAPRALSSTSACPVTIVRSPATHLGKQYMIRSATLLVVVWVFLATNTTAIHAVLESSSSPAAPLVYRHL